MEKMSNVRKENKLIIMLKHDKYWNWNIQKGDKVICNIEGKEGLNLGEEYEVVYPQGSPSGIWVKNYHTNEQICAEHTWFSQPESQQILNDTLNNTGSQSQAMWVDHCDQRYIRKDLVIKAINKAIHNE